MGQKDETGCTKTSVGEVARRPNIEFGYGLHNMAKNRPWSKAGVS
jgi:hypothetical protein